MVRIVELKDDGTPLFDAEEASDEENGSFSMMNVYLIQRMNQPRTRYNIREKILGASYTPDDSHLSSSSDIVQTDPQNMANDSFSSCFLILLVLFVCYVGLIILLGSSILSWFLGFSKAKRSNKRAKASQPRVTSTVDDNQSMK